MVNGGRPAGHRSRKAPNRPGARPQGTPPAACPGHPAAPGPGSDTGPARRRRGRLRPGHRRPRARVATQVPATATVPNRATEIDRAARQGHVSNKCSLLPFSPSTASPAFAKSRFRRAPCESAFRGRRNFPVFHKEYFICPRSPISAYRGCRNRTRTARITTRLRRPGSRHPGHPRWLRRPRPVAHRLGQDARLRDAAGRHASRPPRRRSRGADPLADARARAADRRGAAADRQGPSAADRRRLRRRRPRAPSERWPAAAHRRRHARPPRGPDRSAGC